MQQRNFYLVADYKEDGKHRNGQYIIQAEDEQNAVCWLLWELKKSGADVLLITSVYGVNSIQELKEAAEWENGLRPGILAMLYICSASIFEEMEEAQ